MRIALMDLYTNAHHLKYASELVAYLQDRGHQVMFITWAKDKRVYNALMKRFPSLTIVSLSKKGSSMGLDTSLLLRQIRTLRIYSKAFKEAERWQADILHMLYITSFIPHCLMSFKHWQFRLFGTMFGTPGLTTNTSGSARAQISQRLLRFFFKQSVSRSFQGMFVHNVYPQKVKKEFEQLGSLSESRKKLIFLHDPIYEDFSTLTTQDKARERLKLPNKCCILLFFGELTRGKGPDVLLEAILEVQREICVVIAGAPGSFSQEDVNTYKKNLGQSQKIIDRLGFVPEEDVASYFMSADAIVMPYKRSYEAGTSGVLMQAYSARKPVICSDVGSIGQLVKSCSWGIVVTPESPHDLAVGITSFIDRMDEIKDAVKERATNYMAAAKWESVANEIMHGYWRN